MTTELQKLGHRIQAIAILDGNNEVASLEASLLGELGSYEEAKVYLTTPDWAHEDYPSKEPWE